MKVIKSENIDYFNHSCYYASETFGELPPKLEWIEPSINMLYLEALSSYIFGNYFSSIISMGILLEHVLRLAIYDKKSTSLNRRISPQQLDNIGMLSKLIEKANEDGLITEEEIPWWKFVAKVIRNKSAHYILPRLLRDFTRHSYEGEEVVKDKYHPKHYKFTHADGTPESSIMHDWGAFYHKSNKYICKTFLQDSYVAIKSIIDKTEWEPDRSWWKSQENLYNMFFEYSWKFEDMPFSIDKYFTDLS